MADKSQTISDRWTIHIYLYSQLFYVIQKTRNYWCDWSIIRSFIQFNKSFYEYTDTNRSINRYHYNGSFVDVKYLFQFISIRIYIRISMINWFFSSHCHFLLFLYYIILEIIWNVKPNKQRKREYIIKSNCNVWLERQVFIQEKKFNSWYNRN